MPLEQGFLEWFNQTVTIEPFTGVNVNGEPQYGAAVQYSAFVQRRTRLVRDRAGQEVVSTAQVYLDGSVDVGIQDRITLPDGSQPVILSIEVLPDETGSTHHKVVNT
ncbi:MAG: hypothetical protein JRE40_10505 [Deltaproteobacteria bacterium]|nr:hypothetical protein [Deltaproteobacteria bacterium]